MLMYLSAAAGLVLLFGGGEFLVRGAVLVSRRLGLSPLLIGMTVVAWCTSAPELVVSLGAALEGRSDIAVGNVVGSNIFNILGILGVTALVKPIGIAEQIASVDVWIMLAASLALVPMLLWRGRIGRFTGGVLLLGYAAYMAVLF